jgi:hypothetical protein
MHSLVCLVTHTEPIWTIFGADHEERIILFTDASKSDPNLPFDPLLRWVYSRWLSAPAPCDTSPRILETQDDFVQLKTSQILTVLLRFVRHSPLLSTEIHANDLQRRESSSPTVATATPLKLSIYMRTRNVSK